MTDCAWINPEDCEQNEDNPTDCPQTTDENNTNDDWRWRLP